VRTDTAIGKEASVILGVSEAPGARRRRSHLAALDRRGMDVLGQRHFARCRMAALAIAEQLLRELAYTRRLPPVLEGAAQRRRVAAALERGAGIDLGEGGADGGDVAAMAVDEIEALEAVARQRSEVVADDRDERRWPQGDAAGKGQVMLRVADIDGRPDQRAHRLADAGADCLGADRVGADEAVRPVLLGRADRHDDALGCLEIILDLLPGLEM